MGSKVFTSVVVPLSILLPILTGLLRFTNLSAAAKKILLLLLISGLVNAAATVVGRYYHQNNFPIIHAYTPVELAFIMWIYVDFLSLQKYKWHIIAMVIVFSLLCVVNALYLQSIYTYCSYTRSLEAIFCILLSLNLFAKLAAEEVKVQVSAGFYFNAGFFIYFTSAFMLFVFSNFSVWNLSQSDFRIIWVIHAAIVLIQYVLFTLGFMYAKSN